MKLSVFLLSALLALCSAAPQSIMVENSPTDEEVLPDPPETSPGGSDPAPPAPAEPVKNRTALSSPFSLQDSLLEWKTWDGIMPSNAVGGIYNSHAHRVEYICKYGCLAGFFNGDTRNKCQYPDGSKVLLGAPFQFLVWKGNSQTLFFLPSSWGAVHRNSVKTCSAREIYVGMNEYGLGMVDVGQQAFFRPMDGVVLWSRNYKVLTIT